VNITIPGRRCAALFTASVGIVASNPSLPAQTPTADTSTSAQVAATGSVLRVSQHEDSLLSSRGHFYRRFAKGVATSVLLHEAAHVGASYAMGFHPHLGLDKGRPTIFSGIDEFVDRRQQFIFSAAGLTVQNVLDELVLDIPHHRCAAFERGILAGGLGTTLFYLTIGRNARVSDVSVMARTSHLSKSQVSVIYGSVAAFHSLRMSRDHAFSHFFLAPGDRGKEFKAGLSLRTR
jgi:hypothetical protein